MFQTIAWANDRLRMIDQTRLPVEEAYIETTDYRVVCAAVRRLAVRGAPAIGVAGAYAVALAAAELADDGFVGALHGRASEIERTRPTAVNLAWAIRQSLPVAERAPDPAAARRALLEFAVRLNEDDIAVNHRIGAHGADLVPDGATVLTHCNAGSLATAGYGTALGVIRSAVPQGKRIAVIAGETRPLLQGARLTAWELLQDGISVTLIADTATGSMMQQGLVTCVVVGADRVAANGDVANKIGTYQVAVLAREHAVPFYVAAPTSTIDLEVATGAAIPIEEREAREVTHFRDLQTAPDGVSVRNPAFDITPSRFVTAIITEEGLARAPFEPALHALVARGDPDRRAPEHATAGDVVNV